MDFKAFPIHLVSFAAVIRVVTQCSLEPCIPFLKLTNKEQASISWKPGPLPANITRNMIGAAANSYMHVVGSSCNKGKGRQSLSEQPLVGEERYVTTLIMAAKETTIHYTRD